MTAIVGLDLGPRSAGALRVAAWLASRLGERVVPVHVVEEERLRALLKVHHLDEVIAAAGASARTVLAEAGVEGALEPPRVLAAPRADRGLAQVAGELGASLVVAGRISPREGHELVRLGPVARRLLRSLPAPVMVVPPDATAERLGDGPVVALVSAAPDCVAACRFAATLARAAARPLLHLHVLPFIPEGLDAVVAGSYDALVAAARASALADLDGWLASAGLAGDRREVLLGDPVEAALRLAGETRALALVAGVRHRAWHEALADSSVGRELAAIAPCPVVVVPGPRDAEVRAPASPTS
jgi:nucleotide-binding universal stress UspA family protein